MRLHNGTRRLKRGVIEIKLAAVLMAAVMVPGLSPLVPVKAVTLSQAKNQQSTLEEQQKENEALLAQLKGNRKKKDAYAQAINAQITVLEKQINTVLKQLTALDKALAAEEEALAKGSKDDEKAHRQNLAQLKTTKSRLSDEKSDIQAKSLRLTELYDEAQQLMKEVGESEQEVQAKAESLKREQKITEEAIDAWYADYRQKLKEVGVNSGNLGGDVYLGTGHFQWPMPGYTGITQYFGGEHRGIDIAGEAIYGKSIVSADQGTVAYAGWMGTYGYVVFVDHGGYQTRYAHMSALGCQVGDSVGAGQVIGYVGSTGNSTGPHLHFEMLYDGALLNPFDYF